MIRSFPIPHFFSKTEEFDLASPVMARVSQNTLYTESSKSGQLDTSVYTQYTLTIN